MSTLRDLCTPDAPESIERSPHLPAAHPTALDALCRCRTGAYGSRLSACARCGQPHHIAQAGGHRHGPQCQQPHAAPWLPHHLDTPRPGGSFLSTFPVPDALRPLGRSPPRLASQSLCSASAQARTRLAQAPRFLGTTRPGFPGILPTWGRPLPSHPHSHAIVPGGGLAQDRAAWVPSSTNFSVPVRARSPISRALCQHERRPAGQLAQIDPHGWTTPWNVHRQANPPGATSCTSLAP
jgi:Transposase zinc-binding domain/Putative transposase